MTDTPRTDTHVKILRKEAGISLAGLVAIDFARTLERDLAARDAEIAEQARQLALLQYTLKACRDQFAEYAALHWAKNTDEGDIKAVVNEGLVKMCDGALNLAQPKEPT